MNKTEKVRLKIEISNIGFKFEIQDELVKVLGIAINTLKDYQKKLDVYTNSYNTNY